MCQVTAKPFIPDATNTQQISHFFMSVRYVRFARTKTSRNQR